jgi:hypothetical protein
VTKFVGKFRKNKEYNDDYDYTPKRSKNEHAEIKKLLTQYEEEQMLEETEAEAEDEKNWYN